MRAVTNERADQRHRGNCSRGPAAQTNGCPSPFSARLEDDRLRESTSRKPETPGNPPQKSNQSLSLLRPGIRNKPGTKVLRIFAGDHADLGSAIEMILTSFSASIAATCMGSECSVTTIPPPGDGRMLSGA